MDYDALNALVNIGYQTLNRGIIFGKFINACTDLPARAGYLGMKGHNAISGCSLCNTQGQVVGRRMFMSLRHEPALAQLARTDMQVIKDAEEVEKLLEQHQAEGRKSNLPSVNGFYISLKCRVLILCIICQEFIKKWFQFGLIPRLRVR